MMLVLVLAAQLAVPTGTFHHCGLRGTAKIATVGDLNVLKNRAVEPTIINTAITLEALLAPGDDSSRWSTDDGARVTGYVTAVRPGGSESVNCGAVDLAFRDTHIEIRRGPDDTALPLIAEVTPRWRAAMKAAGVDWSTAMLKRTLVGHYVEFTGLLLWDVEHVNAATNTHPKGAHNWRVSAWEVCHPCSAIRVLP